VLRLLRSSHAAALRPDVCFGSIGVAPIVTITQSSTGARGSRTSTTMPETGRPGEEEVVQAALGASPPFAPRGACESRWVRAAILALA
jgi:hypothetical protein